MDTIQASEVLNLPPEALPGVTDDCDLGPSQAWAALYELARTGHTALELEATSSRWEGRRRIIADREERYGERAMGFGEMAI